MNNEVPHTVFKSHNQELNSGYRHVIPVYKGADKNQTGFYDWSDGVRISGFSLKPFDPTLAFETLDELLKRDEQREIDGFPRRIRLGKIFRSVDKTKGKVIVVPTTTEPKFYHDDSFTMEDGDEGESGGTGEGDDGQVVGEKPVDQEGQTGQGAGQGEGGEHETGTEAFDLGKVLTEQFKLPNLEEKGTKRSFTNYVYDLTDKNRRFGQLLDKKSTLRKLIETNILLGRIKPDEPFDSKDLLISPDDHIYRILSKEKAFEAQAMVFFLRDYSSSMNGNPTEVVTSQHLLIYSWLMYQYKNRVETRFIVHDTQAKEVVDFYTYYRVSVAGGTQVYTAFDLVNEIVENESIARDYNIYVFYGTDGDDWDTSGNKTIEAIRKMLSYCNRIGITIAKNDWAKTAGYTVVEDYIHRSGLLKKHSDKFKMDAMISKTASEKRIIEGIKKLLE